VEDARIVNFFKNYDKESKGYVGEKDFVEFYKEATLRKASVVW